MIRMFELVLILLEGSVHRLDQRKALGWIVPNNFRFLFHAHIIQIFLGWNVVMHQFLVTLLFDQLKKCVGAFG